MNVYIDFLGYYPNTKYIILSENDENKWLAFDSCVESIACKIKKEGWTLILNPRFKHSPAHISFVDKIKSL